MPNPELNSLDDFELFVRSTIKPWSPEQRIALTVSMAERWLPVYKTFSNENQWGDPATFQRAVQSVWNCVLGHELTRKERRLHEDRVSENTPDFEDFDCDEVVATSAMIGWALNCCSSADNTNDAVMAVVCGFEAVAHGIYQDTHWSEIEDQVQNVFKLTDETMGSIRERMVSSTDAQPTKPDVWHLPQVKDELEKQRKLLKLIGDMVQIDEQHIEALRQQLASPDLVGTLVPRPEPSRGLTNEATFEQYRRWVELDIKNKWELERAFDDLRNIPGAIASTYVMEWERRYSRRKQALEEGPMLDVAAHHALLARYSAHDAAAQGDPGWNQDIRFWIDLHYQNPGLGLDVNSAEEPHSYGPSLRRLWIERKQTGDSDEEICKSLMQWGQHRPPAWEEEDRRKKKGLAYATPELAEGLTRELSWRRTDDIDHPWATEVAGETWRVRLNDFPDDLMYTLIINDAVIGKFHDWPEAWQR